MNENPRDPDPANLLHGIPSALPQELYAALLSRPGMRIERIVSLGHHSAEGFWYDQPEHEFVVLIAGAARLEFEDGPLEMHPGSYVDIPAHRRHRVAWTTPHEPTVWLAIFYG
jgi:cupin 2 domain-containing protein